MKKFMKFGLVGIILIAAVLGLSVFFNPKRLTPEDSTGKTIYYTRVNKEGVKQNSNERYEYTLDTYGKSNKVKSLIFTSSKQLREGAYLELYTALFRGVTYWQEIQFEDLPEAIKSRYDN